MNSLTIAMEQNMDIMHLTHVRRCECASNTIVKGENCIEVYSIVGAFWQFEP